MAAIHHCILELHYIYLIKVEMDSHKTYSSINYLLLTWIALPVVHTCLHTCYTVHCVCVLAPCIGSAFFCHSNMCINNSLVCNGIQNCVFPWDESDCQGTPGLLKHWQRHTLLICLGVLQWLVLCCAVLCVWCLNLSVFECNSVRFLWQNTRIL